MKALVALITALCTLQVSAQSPNKSSFYIAHVFLQSGDQVYTRWVHADANGLTLRLLSDTSQIVHYHPQEIQRINIRKSNASTRNAFYGAAIGFAVGFGAGWAEYDNGHNGNINQVGRAAGTGILSAFGGAFIGFITGSFFKTYWIAGREAEYKRLLPKLSRFNTKSVS